jgi:hypothetical protein
MVWVKYLVDRGGGDRVHLRRLWEAMAETGSWQAGHEQALPSHFGIASLAAAAAEFAAWNWFACRHDDGRHYDPATVGCELAPGVIAPRAAALPASGERGPVGAFGSAYLEMVPDCASADLQVRVRPDADMRIQLIGELGPEGVLAAADAEREVETVLILPRWNHHRRVALVATDTGGGGARFHWEAAASGSYTSPASLPPPRELSLAPETLDLGVGERAPVSATATFGTCEDGRDLGSTVAWESSRPEVAVVRAGNVEALGPGSAEIVASSGEVRSRPLVVTVTDPPDSGGCAVGGGRWPWSSGLLAAAALCLGVLRRAVKLLDLRVNPE